MNLPVERRVQALGRFVVIASVLKTQRLSASQQQLPRVALKFEPFSPRLRPLGGFQQGGGRGFGVGTKVGRSAPSCAGCHAAARQAHELARTALKGCRVAQLGANLLE